MALRFKYLFVVFWFTAVQGADRRPRSRAARIQDAGTGCYFGTRGLLSWPVWGICFVFKLAMFFGVP